MSPERTTPRLAELSPVVKAKIAGILYLVNIATSLIAFLGKGSRSLIIASGLTANALINVSQVPVKTSKDEPEYLPDER